MLILSNGHGEDAIGSLLGRHLAGEGVELAAFPLVGTGHAYRQAGIPVLQEGVLLPSGGFARLGWSQFWGDVRAGMLGSLLRQARFLRRVAAGFQQVMAIGDIVPLLLGAWAARRPLVFHSTAKSDFIRGHLGVEVALMRRHCGLVFTRDEPTAHSLRDRGVPARCVGNLMMDMVTPKGVSLPIPPGSRLVLLLPGSRQDAYDNLMSMLQAVPLIARESQWSFAVALASGLEVGEIGRRARAGGWELDDEAGSLGEPAAAGPGTVRIAVLRRGQLQVLLVSSAFGDLLHRACVCIGLAGTANEQAVGLGIPVVAFPGRGFQYTPRFLAAQKRLLGDGLIVADPDPPAVAEAVRRAAFDENLRERARRAGRERMGPPGAAARMAEALKEFWGQSAERPQGATNRAAGPARGGYGGQ